MQPFFVVVVVVVEICGMHVVYIYMPMIILMRLDRYRIKVVVEYIIIEIYTVCTTWFADDNIDEIRIKEVKYKKESLNTPPPHTYLPTYLPTTTNLPS
jgi:hypothetical protein